MWLCDRIPLRWVTNLTILVAINTVVLVMVLVCHRILQDLVIKLSCDITGRRLSSRLPIATLLVEIYSFKFDTLFWRIICSKVHATFMVSHHSVWWLTMGGMDLRGYGVSSASRSRFQIFSLKFSITVYLLKTWLKITQHFILISSILVTRA